jgi:hypothetical protein
MYLGGGTLAWMSDYSQIYLVDVATPAIEGIDTFPVEIFERDFYVTPEGMIIFTVDCLRQEIRVSTYDAPAPASTQDLMSETAWTKQIETELVLPSKAFVLSSPSKCGGEAWAPVFKAPAARLTARISWLVHESDHYDAFRPKADIIQIELWPAA